MSGQAPENPGIAGATRLSDFVQGNIVKSAGQMPEANDAFRPTADVRRFGAILGHVAVVKFPGGDLSRLSIIGVNTAHNFEHYGNVITYLRQKGLVPPSSQPTR